MRFKMISLPKRDGFRQAKRKEGGCSSRKVARYMNVKNEVTVNNMLKIVFLLLFET